MTILEALRDGLADVRGHKLRTALQTVGIVLGVASLVAVQGLVDAGRRQSVKFFDEFGGLTKLLVVNKRIKTETLTAQQLKSHGLTWDDAEAIRAGVKEARLVEPFSEAYLAVRAPAYRRMRDVRGVTPDYQAVYRFYVERGRFVTADDVATAARVVVLGDSAARDFFANDEALGKTVYLDDVGFTVVGVMQRKEFFFEGGNHNALEWMNRSVFVPLSAVHARFSGDTDRRVDMINVVVHKVSQAGPAVDAIGAIVARRHGGVRDFEVFNRNDRLAQRQDQERTFNATFLGAGIVSLLVGGIVIMNIMLASFRERIREVGVRKALGARGGQIAVQFLVEAVLVTAIGGAVGLVVGIGFARGITALIGAPTEITPRMALVSLVSSVSVGLFFGLYPAVKAARLPPVDALRYE